MLHAILHGKLSREEEGMEDLLTSCALGVMKYLPHDETLLPFLSLARNPWTGLALSDWLQEVVAVERFEFWPTWRSPGCIPCQPDVELLFRHRNDSLTWLLIEAKYFSGKSSHPSGPDEPPNDQLAREFDNLRVAAEARGIRRYALVYLTADHAAPMDELEESRQEYQSKRKQPLTAFWLSWRELPELLNQPERLARPLLRDLREALVRRFDLTAYTLEIEHLRPICWRFSGSLRLQTGKQNLVDAATGGEEDVSANGEELFRDLRAWTGFLGTLGHLLQNAESLMKEKGWNPLGGDKTALYRRSRSMATGTDWLGSEAYRMYRHPAYPNAACMIAILLDDPGEALSEPAVSATLFTFSVPPKTIDVRAYSVYAHLISRVESPLTGQVTSTTKGEQNAPVLPPWEAAKVFAYPLVRIRTHTDIKSLIIDPLHTLVATSFPGEGKTSAKRDPKSDSGKRK